MADIFLSYASEDRDKAGKIAALLEASGWSVWWDRRIPAGRTWRSVIQEALTNMRCMVVLWSKNSVDSEWVKEEAEEGRALGKLVPIMIERVMPPLGLRGIQAADFADWDGSSDASGSRQLIDDLEAILGRPAPVAARQETMVSENQDTASAATAAGEISALRQRLASTSSARQMKELLYAAEALLARQPNDESTRLFKDEIVRAMAAPVPIETPAIKPGDAARPRQSPGGEAMQAWPRRSLAIGLGALIVVVGLLWFALSGNDRGKPPIQPAASSGQLPPAASESSIPASPAPATQSAAPVATQVPAPLTAPPGPTTPAAPVLGPTKSASEALAPDVRLNEAAASQRQPAAAAAHRMPRDAAKKARCEAILERATLGQPLSDKDRAFLKGC